MGLKSLKKKGKHGNLSEKPPLTILFFLYYSVKQVCLQPSLIDLQIVPHSVGHVFSKRVCWFFISSLSWEKGFGETRLGKPFFRYPTQEAGCQLRAAQGEESGGQITGC